MILEIKNTKDNVFQKKMEGSVNSMKYYKSTYKDGDYFISKFIKGRKKGRIIFIKGDYRPEGEGQIYIGNFIDDHIIKEDDNGGYITEEITKEEVMIEVI